MVRIYYRFRQQRLKHRGIRIGSNTFISHKAYIDSHKGAKVIIGSNCFITRNVIILNHTDTGLGGPKSLYVPYGGDRVLADVEIGDNVFIGVGSVVMPGVKICDNSVIGALSLVTKDVPANRVYAGQPAKEICSVQDMLERSVDNFDREGWIKEFGE